MATHSSILAWRVPWTEETGDSSWGHKDLDMAERLNMNAFIFQEASSLLELEELKKKFFLHFYPRKTQDICDIYHIKVQYSYSIDLNLSS